MILKIPFPPSTNNLYLNMRGRGRVQTPAYRAWIIEAGAELKRQVKPPCFADDDRVVIKIDLDDTRRGDADNRNKAILDALVSAGVIPGDSKKHVKRVSIGWERVKECRVEITKVAA